MVKRSLDQIISLPKKRRFKIWTHFIDADKWFQITNIQGNEITLHEVDKYGCYMNYTKRSMPVQNFLYMVLGGEVKVQAKKMKRSE